MIVVDHVTKEYRIGERTAAYGMLRDAGPRMIRAGLPAASGEPADDSMLKALDDVSFEVRAGETVGIIGRNGAGKSTLLKVLGRITQPTHGSIDLYGRVGSLLEVGTGFPPGVDRPRERLPERRDSRHAERGDPAAVRRHRRLRGGRAVHRHAREVLLERHVHAAGVRGGRASAPRDPADRRSARGGRRRTFRSAAWARSRNSDRSDARCCSCRTTWPASCGCASA